MHPPRKLMVWLLRERSGEDTASRIRYAPIKIDDFFYPQPKTP